MRHTHRGTTPRTRHGGRRRIAIAVRPHRDPDVWIPRLQRDLRRSRAAVPVLTLVPDLAHDEDYAAWASRSAA